MAVPEVQSYVLLGSAWNKLSAPLSLSRHWLSVFCNVDSFIHLTPRKCFFAS